MPSYASYATGLTLKRAVRMIIVGAPGVGKGTHTERLLNRYPQLSSISSGDLLRENVRKKTRIGVWITLHLKDSRKLTASLPHHQAKKRRP